MEQNVKFWTAAYRLVYSTRAPVYISHNADDDGRRPRNVLCSTFTEGQIEFFPPLFTRVSQYDF